MGGPSETFGRYELLELLGRGGMGEVYRAHDREHDRTVALKVLPPHLAGDAQFTARFRREARLAAQLTDPHVVPIHDFGEIDGRLYIDMRLVRGTDLGDLLTDVGPLPPPVAVHIVGEIASALDAAHEEGLIHRDVKPGNVMLTRVVPGFPRMPFAYLLDFGIARSLGAGTALTTTSSATLGTLAYMAPERINGEANDPRSDVYALACTLFEALTGHPPFAGEPVALLYAHLHAVPPPTGVSPALDGVVARGMAKEAGARYATASEFAEAAAAALAGAAQVEREERASAPVPAPLAGPPGSPAPPRVTTPPRDTAPPHDTARSQDTTPTAAFTPPAAEYARPTVIAAPPSVAGTDPAGAPYRAASGRNGGRGGRGRRRTYIAVAAVLLVAAGVTAFVLARSPSSGSAAQDLIARLPAGLAGSCTAGTVSADESAHVVCVLPGTAGPSSVEAIRFPTRAALESSVQSAELCFDDATGTWAAGADSGLTNLCPDSSGDQFLWTYRREPILVQATGTDLATWWSSFQSVDNLQLR